MRMTPSSTGSQSSNGESAIANEINVLKGLFTDIFIVDPIHKTKAEIVGYRLRNTERPCSDQCPLAKDTCGCICKDVLSSNELRCRLTFSTASAYFIMSKPFKTKYIDYVIVMILHLSTNFSFGDIPVDEAVNTITRLSSTLVIDPLTKLYNRKYLSDNINFMIERCKQSHQPLCLACIDIDNFKKFNDTYGHEFGDKVLISVANNMIKIAKMLYEAYCIRIGGDEFMVVAIDINKQKFKMAMKNLCDAISDTKLQYEKQRVGIKISVGVSELLADNVETYRELYNKADAQLYEAKEAGKGCVR